MGLCFAATVMDESQFASPKRRNDLPVGLEIEVPADVAANLTARGFLL